ncbi:molecular chaperone TorD family protein [Meiothermus cerbereus]|uniref:molecular chaperone TorD family protein n=1 Tax=Meiothermus cerbereus TaxID=65552 RepID=UPI003EEBA641
MKALLQTLALAYQYPKPGSTKALWDELQDLPRSRAKNLLERFLKAISELKLAEREELYTRTLELTPLTAPYVGYAVYGEDYRRGRFMAELNAEYAALGIETAGEIPDHLIPILRYLAVATEPLPELLQLLEPALHQMMHTLKTLEPKNPYLLLLEATREAIQPISKGVPASPTQALPVAMGSLFSNLPFFKGGRE